MQLSLKAAQDAYLLSKYLVQYKFIGHQSSFFPIEIDSLTFLFGSFFVLIWDIEGTIPSLKPLSSQKFR